MGAANFSLLRGPGRRIKTNQRPDQPAPQAQLYRMANAPLPR